MCFFFRATNENRLTFRLESVNCGEAEDGSGHSSSDSDSELEVMFDGESCHYSEQEHDRDLTGGTSLKTGGVKVFFVCVCECWCFAK